MLFSRKGFSLAEMLIVIALVGLFIVATNFLTRDVRIAQTNSEKFANTIEDTIKNARNSMVIGKGVYTGGTLFKAEKRIVSITASGVSASYQYNGTNTGSESSSQWPFFDNDSNYQITDISVSSGRLTDIASMQWDYTGVENTDIVMLPNGDISITAIKGGTIIPANEINSLRITAGYAGMERSVILDRFIGNTEVIKGRDGITAAYVAPPPAPVAVNGACNGIVKLTCDAGTVSNPSNGSCGGNATWTCTGSDGGTDAACTMPNGGCSVNGACDNTTKFACTSGTSINNTTGACGTTDTWNCDGIDGGTTSVLCSKASDPCNVSGVCGGTANTCTAGNPSGYSTGSCGGSQTWSCDGSGTGSTAACSILNSACINGSCNTPFNSATTPTPTCATGTPTAVSGTGPWTWGCNSTNGGTNTTATACIANKIVDCVGSWVDNAVPYCSATCGGGNLQQTFTITTPAANGGLACVTYNGNTRWGASSCNTGACPTPASVTAWSACSLGTQSRTCTEQTGGDPTTCASLGAVPGVNNQSCGNNGTCDNSTQFACSSGNSVSNVTNYTGASCGGTSTWGCNGISGGTNTTATACTKVNPLCAVNGVCGGSSNTCTAGTASGYLAGSCGGSQTWSCVGANGGSTAACNIANAACPINGLCNVVFNSAATPTPTCATGTPTAVSGTGPWTWGCNGANGGTNTTTNACSANKTDNGSCNATFNSATTPTPTCAVGTPTAVSGTGPWTWGCNGISGGTNTAPNACTANKIVDCIGSWGSCSNGSQTYTITTPAANGGSACVATNGATQSCGTPAVCNTPFNSATTPTPTCATGTPTAVSGTGPWTWGCNSTNGGTNTTATACIANKIVDCVGSWVDNAVPYCSATCGGGNLQQTFTITTPAANGGLACVTYNGNTRWGASSCNTGACPTPASVTAWSACSLGTQSRTCTEQTGGDPTTCASLGAVPGVNNQSCGNNGTCDNSTQFACSSGNSVSNVTNYTGASCGGTSTWGCNGISGGTNTTATACTKVNPLCAVNGVCGGSSNTCTAGTASGYLAGSCGGSQTWSCVGANGGSTAACNITNTPCPQVVSCGGSIPANATASTATTYTQTWNGSIWTPTTSWSESQATCDFDCNSGYMWNGSACVSTSCTGTPWGTVTHGTSVTAYASASPAGACSSESRTCTNGVLSGTNTVTSCTPGCTGTPWGSVASGYSNTAYSASSVAWNASCSTVAQTRTCTAGSMNGTYTITSCTPAAALNCTGTPWGTVTHGTSVTAYASASPAGACSSESRTCTNGVLSGTNTVTSCTPGCTGTPWGSVASGYSNTAYSASSVAWNASCSTVAQTRTCTAGSMNGTYTITSCTPAAALNCTGTPWGTVTHGTSVTAYASASPAGACSSESRTCTNGVLSGTNTVTSCTPGCTGTPWGSVASGYSNTAYSASSVAWNASCSTVAQTRTCTAGSMNGTYTITSCTPAAALNCTGTPWGTVTHGTSVTAYASASPAGACSSESRTCTNGVLSGTNTVTSCTPGCTGTPWGSVASGYSNTAYSASSVAWNASCSTVAQTRTCTAGSMNGTYTITSCTPAAALNCTGTPWGTVTHGTSVTAYASASPAGACSSESRTCTNGVLSGTNTVTSCTPGCTGTPWGSVASGYSNTAYSASSVAWNASCSTVAQTRTCTAGSMNGTYTITSCTPAAALNCTGTPWGTVTHGTSVTGWLATNPVYPTTCASESRTCTNGTLAGSYINTACTQGYTYAWTTGSYGSCSVSCGGGTQTRTVSCQRNDLTIVADAFCGGGKPVASQSCNTGPCPIDCSGSWSAYGSCSTTCGTGTKSRTFTQTVSAQYGGASCTSLYGVENGGTSSTSCTDTSGTTDWYDVSSCSTVCGTGTKSQSNSCGGSRSVSCTDTSGNTQWGAYGACDTICGTGTKTRTNACGGTSSTSCTDTSGNTQWGAYGSCSPSCGPGTQTRTNACGGTQDQSCNNGACAVNGSCNWSTKFACNSGTSGINSNNYTNTSLSCGGSASWVCNGSNGGTSDGPCFYSNPACPAPPVINGSCGSTAGTCNSPAAPTADDGNTACGTTRHWWCDGSNGGTNTPCNKANPACACVPNGTYNYGPCSVSGACGQTGYMWKYDSCGAVVDTNVSCSTAACANVSWSWGCFVAGTQVTMASGITKSIEKVLVGELVRTYDESTKKFIDRPVSSIQHHDAKIQTFYTFVYGDNTVTSNSIHRYYLPIEDKYYSAEDIYKKWKNGEKVLLLDGIKNIGVPITDISIDEKNTPVYNLHVDGIHDDNGMCDKYKANHNYIANGIVVHNLKDDTSTEDYDLFVNYCAAMVQTNVCNPHSPNSSNNFTLSCWGTTTERTNFYNCMPY